MGREGTVLQEWIITQVAGGDFLLTEVGLTAGVLEVTLVEKGGLLPKRVVLDMEVVVARWLAVAEVVASAVVAAEALPNAVAEVAALLIVTVYRQIDGNFLLLYVAHPC